MSTLGRVWYARRHVLVDLVPAALYLALLFWAGLMPMKSLPGPDFELADKVWHALAFGGLAALVARAVRHFERPPLAAARIGAAMSTLLGALLEVFQAFTRYRSADVADLAADAFGALVAYWVLLALARAAGLLQTEPAT
jgi:VanZ family protein